MSREKVLELRVSRWYPRIQNRQAVMEKHLLFQLKLIKCWSLHHHLNSQSQHNQQLHEDASKVTIRFLALKLILNEQRTIKNLWLTLNGLYSSEYLGMPSHHRLLCPHSLREKFKINDTLCYPLTSLSR